MAQCNKCKPHLWRNGAKPQPFEKGVVFFVRIVLTTSALSSLYCKTYESARTEQFFSFFIMIPLQHLLFAFHSWTEAIVTLVIILSHEHRPRDKYSDVI